MRADIRVEGLPWPKGSISPMVVGKRVFVGGLPAIVNPRVVMVSGARIKRADGTYSTGREKHRLWTAAVKDAAFAWRIAHGMPALLNEPLSFSFTFYLPRPKSAPKRLIYPAKKPDLDKLARSVFDALTDVLVVDDGLFVHCNQLRKLFAPSGTMPCAFISVESIT